MNKSISVIIPTKNRPVLLDKVLESLAAQSTPIAEVIIVDNSSPESLRANRRSIKKYKQLSITFIHLKKSNASKSRNEGIRRSSGDILAFLDDDSVPESDWAKEIRQAASLGDFCFRGFYIDFLVHDSMIFEFYKFFKELQNRLRGKEWSTFQSYKGYPIVDSIQAGNFFCPRKIIDQIVPVFDEKRFPFIAEEIDFSLRLREAGFQILHAEKVKVKHYFLRLGFYSFVIYSAFWYGRADAIFSYRRKKFFKKIGIFNTEIKKHKKNTLMHKLRYSFGLTISLFKEKYAYDNVAKNILFMAIYVVYFLVFGSGKIYGSSECLWLEKVQGKQP